MSNDYNFKIHHNVPKWDDLTYEKIGSNMSFLKLNISMEVYQNDELIYSVKLDIDGIYSCCGSKNFEFDKMNYQFIKNYDETAQIHTALLSKYDEYFKDTVIGIWKFRICDGLCDI